MAILQIVLEAFAEQYPFRCANAFMSYDLVTDGNSNLMPDNVELLCAWTWMCSFQNIHANEVDYGVIAEQFYSVMPEIPGQ